MVAALVQRESLHSIAKYGSVGAVELTGGKDCTAEVVLSKFMGQTPGARVPLKKGSGIVLIWGRVFQAGREVYLQSYLQFLRRGVVESVDLEVKGKKFTGRLSSQAFASIPRRISRDDLRRIEQEFEQKMFVYSEPVETAPREAIPPGLSYPYWVTEVKGDWMKIRADAPGRSGWIRARLGDAEWSLKSKIPDMAFVEGVTGYLRYRIAHDRRISHPTAPDVPQILPAASAALRAYLDTWSASALKTSDSDSKGGSTPLCLAVPAQLLGMITLLKGETTGGVLTEAHGYFAQAVELVPYSADARNLELITRLAMESRSETGTDTGAAAASLLSVVGSEPENEVALRNLQQVYELKLETTPAGPQSAAEREELQRQIQAIKRLSARRAQ
jgi:hypothetical protein